MGREEGGWVLEGGRSGVGWEGGLNGSVWVVRMLRVGGRKEQVLYNI